MIPAWRMPPPKSLRLRRTCCDHLGVARHGRADRRAEALREADRDRVDLRHDLRRRDAERDGRVPEPGAVHVHAHVAAARERRRSRASARAARPARPPRRRVFSTQTSALARVVQVARRRARRAVERLDVEHAPVAVEQPRLDARERRRRRPARGRRRGASRCTRISSPRPGWARTAAWFPIVPDGTYTAASLPSMRAVSASSSITVGSSPQTSSPTSASAMARRISGVGRVTVSERRSTDRIRAAEYPHRRASPRRRLSTPGQGARIRDGAGGGRGRADRRRRALRRRRAGRASPARSGSASCLPTTPPRPRRSARRRSP